MQRAARTLALALGAPLFSSCALPPGPLPHDGGSATIEWGAFASDAGGTRHSRAAQIHAGNVHQLEVAWTYRTGDFRLGERGGRFEATPLMVEGTLYVSTPFGQVIALDPSTGEERWTYDPQIDLSGGYGDWANRGVATWLDEARAAGGPCRRRIFVAPIDARLIALDAATGRPCPDFGARGTVDLNRDLLNEPLGRGEYQVTSPPAIIGDVVVVGSAIADNQRVDAPSGVVRAFDARTGALRWSWDPIPRDPRLRIPDSWRGRSGDRTGAANAWAPIAVDAARDLVFVPVGSPSPDYYGGERPGRNDYANSVVALRGSTGAVVWHFQAVHHDLWDYDVPAQPVLVTLRRDGREVPALVQATKMGHLFVLHRETGRPLFPVEERPVPPSTVPGEEAWPTQPFPVLPRPIVPQRLTPDEAWGLTPEDRAFCRERIASLRWEGMFTPPSLEGTLVYPGNVGGSNWGGVTYDPARGLLFAPANRLAAAVRLVPRAGLAEAHRARPGAETSPQRGTPYGMQREFILSPGGLPCNPPPWGTLSAIDLATGELRWERALGSMRKGGGAEAWGSLNLGGAMNTAGGLVFASGGFDQKIHAFDAQSGRELWSAELPAGGNASPMTYVVGGRQFVVIAAGGHDRMGTAAGDYVVAFALPPGHAEATVPPAAPLPGLYTGHLIVGGGRFPVSIQLRAGDGAAVAGVLSGALEGPLTGRTQAGELVFEVPFTLPAERCTGHLRGEVAHANRGGMLVGPVRVSGACSDGKEEVGVLAVRRVASPPSSGVPSTDSSWVDRSPHREGFVTANGVRLHYLEWGAAGEPVVMLAGLGDSGHVYDDLAHRLISRFRLIALTRRGHGQSEVPLEGYDVDTLVEDLRQALDALGLDRVHLVGHSMAGGELSRFAELYPERVLRLVYLDAAYDRSGLFELMEQGEAGHATESAGGHEPPRPRSYEELRTRQKAMLGLWSEALENNLRFSTIRDAEGSLRSASPAEIGPLLLDGIRNMRPNYRAIRAPALSLYSVFGTAGAPGPHVRWQRQEIERFRVETSCARVIELPGGHHYIFIEQPERTAEAILSFLLAPDPCRLSFHVLSKHGVLI